MSLEQSVVSLAGESEVLGENLPQSRFTHHKSHMMLPAIEPESPSNRLSYSTAKPGWVT
jgi:hypothetical protein